jgi:hypothetical protein
MGIENGQLGNGHNKMGKIFPSFYSIQMPNYLFLLIGCSIVIIQIALLPKMGSE